jgi:RNA polymerase sigma-70 factor (ECF subfamily)
MSEDAHGSEYGALRTLLDAVRPSLLRAALRVLDDAHDAEDVVQETLAEVWKRRSNLPDRPEAYVIRAVHWNALKRRRRARAHLSLDALPDFAANWLEYPHPRLDVDPLALENAISALPESQRIVVRLKYYVGLTFREIAATLSISSNTAASRCRYALAALKTALTRQRHQTSKE